MVLDIFFILVCVIIKEAHPIYLIILCCAPVSVAVSEQVLRSF